MIKLVLNLFIILIIACDAHAKSIHHMTKELIIEKLSPEVSELEIRFDPKIAHKSINVFDEAVENVQLKSFSPQYSSFTIIATLTSHNVVEISGRYTAYVDLPITTRIIGMGNIINPSDITSTRVPYSKLKAGYATSLSDVIGMQARRSIGNGTLIRNSDLVKPTLIRQNDIVSIIYNQNNIKLRTVGIAMESGAVGDSIKVKNENSNIIVHAIVVGKNLVEVGDK